MPKEKIKIREYPDPILAKRTKKVADPLAPEIQAAIPLMFRAMKEAKGVGLAANQAGFDFRLCVIEEAGEKYVLINPEITAKSRKKVILEEGCLSLPGQFFQVARHESVKVRYLDEKGQKAKLKGSQLLAQALQHEIDHLDGILLIERAKHKK